MQLQQMTQCYDSCRLITNKTMQKSQIVAMLINNVGASLMLINSVALILPEVPAFVTKWCHVFVRSEKNQVCCIKYAWSLTCGIMLQVCKVDDLPADMHVVQHGWRLGRMLSELSDSATCCSAACVPPVHAAQLANEKANHHANSESAGILNIAGPSQATSGSITHWFCYFICSTDQSCTVCCDLKRVKQLYFPLKLSFRHACLA